MWLLLLAACATPYPAACGDYQRLYCDTCELSDFEKTLCTCVKTRKLTSDDFSGKDKPNDDDAQLQCDAWLTQIDYPQPSSSAYCKQQLVLMREHKADICPQQDSGITFDSGL